ncbi:hypothetical protein FFT88_00485 [Escherichia sp. E4930]|nr:hypothetical protein D9740_19575 [Escherichia sp. E14V5]RZN05642.1 hypothetical protein D9741_05275 [Escherichia sp. E14V7]RZN27917.1 hypothetical protein D9739_08295 [Escherichia sp. E14V10]RZN44430.1 hypothetical protein D9597_21580 [Escherichia sp. E13S3]TGB61056.1 hypothetical protein CRT22_01485 [Escherichia sp. E5028]TGB64309.1 hypothetical protein CRG96_23540 [Escherichia sp. E4930]TLI99245.1 hypothetical protein FEK41_08150 [Escherichia sp. E4694]
MVVNDVNDGAKNARFWCALRQNGAVISSKFRQRSQFQNYILLLHNIAFFILFIHPHGKHIHFICT